MLIIPQLSHALFMLLCVINVYRIAVIAQVAELNSSTSNPTNLSQASNQTQFATQTQSNQVPISNTSASSNSRNSTNHVTLLYSNSSTMHGDDGDVPLDIKITTPLSILGALLIVSGAPMGFWGGRNRWSSYFLTGTYLAAMIVMIPILKFGVVAPENPPTRAIETVLLFTCIICAVGAGAVAVIFWKGTRFLVGAAGGFVTGLFVLSLKNNSLIPAVALRWIVILAGVSVGFVLATIPVLSFHVTLFSTAAMGAAAVVLGIDCFTTGGLKEFWLYIVGFGALFPKLNYFPLTVTIQGELALMGGLFVMGAAIQWRLLEIIKIKIDKLKQLDVDRKLQEEVAAYRQSMALDADLILWEKRHGDEVDRKTNPSRRNSQFTLVPIASPTSITPRKTYDDVPYHPNEQLPILDCGVDLANSLGIAEEITQSRQPGGRDGMVNNMHVESSAPRHSLISIQSGQTQSPANASRVSSINFEKSTYDRRFSRPPGTPSTWATPPQVTTSDVAKRVSLAAPSPPAQSAQLENSAFRQARRQSRVPSRVIAVPHQPFGVVSNSPPNREIKMIAAEELDQRHKQAMKNFRISASDKINNHADHQPGNEHRKSQNFDRRISTHSFNVGNERRTSTRLAPGTFGTQNERHSRRKSGNPLNLDQ